MEKPTSLLFKALTQEVKNRSFDPQTLSAQGEFVQNAEGMQHQLLSQGGMMKTPAGTKSDNAAMLAALLARQGVTDVGNVRRTAPGQFVDAATGNTFNARQLESAEGDGYTKFRVGGTAADGGVAFVPKWESSSDRGKVAQALSLAMMFVPGAQGLASSLGGAFGATGATASAIGNAAINAGIGAIGGAKGSDLLKGAVTSAIAPMASGALTNAGLNPILARALTGVGVGALKGQSGSDLLFSGLSGAAGAVDPRLQALVKVLQGVKG